MSDKYASKDIAREATAFAASRFGQHYIKRLEAARDRARSDAENIQLTDSYRAHRSTYAAAKDEEIEYFRIAQNVNRGLLSKLRKEEVTQDV